MYDEELRRVRVLKTLRMLCTTDAARASLDDFIAVTSEKKEVEEDKDKGKKNWMGRKGKKK